MKGPIGLPRSASPDLVDSTVDVGTAMTIALPTRESRSSSASGHVILLDLAMPVLSGLDALPRLRQAAEAAKIIVLSGFSAALVADEVLALGADSYLQKGADIETITATIEHAVAGTASTPVTRRPA